MMGAGALGFACFASEGSGVGVFVSAGFGALEFTGVGISMSPETGALKSPETGASKLPEAGASKSLEAGALKLPDAGDLNSAGTGAFRAAGRDVILLSGVGVSTVSDVSAGVGPNGFGIGASEIAGVSGSTGFGLSVGAAGTKEIFDREALTVGSGVSTFAAGASSAAGSGAAVFFACSAGSGRSLGRRSSGTVPPKESCRLGPFGASLPLPLIAPKLAFSSFGSDVSVRSAALKPPLAAERNRSAAFSKLWVVKFSDDMGAGSVLPISRAIS